MIDADERITDNLAVKLKHIIKEDMFDCVHISKLNYYFGGFLRYGGYMASQPLFFKKDIYFLHYSGAENRVHRDWEGLYRVQRKLILPNSYYYIHYAYPGIEKYACKTLGMYALMEAQQMRSTGSHFNLIRMIIRPIRAIMNRFVLQRGYKDGIRGFIAATLYGVFRFCIWANLWMLEQNPPADVGRIAGTPDPAETLITSDQLENGEN